MTDPTEVEITVDKQLPPHMLYVVAPSADEVYIPINPQPEAGCPVLILQEEAQ